LERVLALFPGSGLHLSSLDMTMRSSLADSLEHIYEAAAGHFDLAADDVAAGLGQIRKHRVSPGVFGRYYDLVFALRAKRYGDAEHLFREIIDRAYERPNFSALPFAVDALGTDAERYARLLGLETGSLLALTAPKADRWSEFRQNVMTALNVIDAADPSLGSELRALVIQVVGADTAAHDGGGDFGGASSFMLWGAVLLNVKRHGTVLDTVAGLIHEGAHQLLFGLSIDDPLVENSIDERYDSPLRRDPRPMDGIFHATFVCARMHYGYARLVQSTGDQISPSERSLAEQRLHDCRRRFFDGLETIQRFARMTPNGKRVLRAASEYMERAN
jgi:hypothetical protein